MVQKSNVLNLPSGAREKGGSFSVDLSTEATCIRIIEHYISPTTALNLSKQHRRAHNDWSRK